MKSRDIADILWGWIEEALQTRDYGRAAQLSLDWAIVSQAIRCEN